MTRAMVHFTNRWLAFMPAGDGQTQLIKSSKGIKTLLLAKAIRWLPTNKYLENHILNQLNQVLMFSFKDPL